MNALPVLSSSAKADDPVFGVAPDQSPISRLLGAPPSRGMTGQFGVRSSWSLLFLLIHRQHALGHKEAAEDVHRGESQRDEAERARPQRPVVIGNQRHADRE